TIVFRACPAAGPTYPLALHGALPISVHPRQRCQQLIEATLVLITPFKLHLRAHLRRQETGGDEPVERPQGIADQRMQEFQVGERSEEHTSELQSRENLVCRLLTEKTK